MRPPLKRYAASIATVAGCPHREPEDRRRQAAELPGNRPWA